MHCLHPRRCHHRSVHKTKCYFCRVGYIVIDRGRRMLGRSQAFFSKHRTAFTRHIGVTILAEILGEIGVTTELRLNERSLWAHSHSSFCTRERWSMSQHNAIKSSSLPAREEREIHVGCFERQQSMGLVMMSEGALIESYSEHNQLRYSQPVPTTTSFHP